MRSNTILFCLIVMVLVVFTSTTGLVQVTDDGGEAQYEAQATPAKSSDQTLLPPSKEETRSQPSMAPVKGGTETSTPQKKEFSPNTKAWPEFSPKKTPKAVSQPDPKWKSTDPYLKASPQPDPKWISTDPYLKASPQPDPGKSSDTVPKPAPKNK